MKGLYVHVPFCIKKCAYCDFYSETDSKLFEPFLNASLKEIEIYKDVGDTSDTIYFGGGTPSVLPVNMLDKILESLYKNNKISSDTEITIEINPGTADFQKLSDLKKSGFNRINFGFQTFADHYLKFLGRIHDSKEAKKVYEHARNIGFENIGLDIIYALPNQTKDDLINDLNEALKLDPEHISAYTLTYEDGTPLKKKLIKNEFIPLEENISSLFFKETSDYLSKNGFNHYEISNFSKDNYYSRHNSKYWNFETYVGFGPSSHSFKNGKRWYKKSNLNEYIIDLKNNIDPLFETEVLSKEQQIIEAVYLGLRQSKGIDIDQFNRKFDCEFSDLFKESMEKFIQKGLMTFNSTNCYLSTDGMILLDYITEDMIKNL